MRKAQDFYDATYNAMVAYIAEQHPDNDAEFDPLVHCDGLKWWKGVLDDNPDMTVPAFTSATVDGLFEGSVEADWVEAVFFLVGDVTPKVFRRRTLEALKYLKWHPSQFIHDAKIQWSTAERALITAAHHRAGG